MWQDLIDINAGPVATGEAQISDIGTELFNKIIAVASGKDRALQKNINSTMICVSLIRHRC